MTLLGNKPAKTVRKGLQEEKEARNGKGREERREGESDGKEGEMRIRGRGVEGRKEGCGEQVREKRAMIGKLKQRRE